MLPCAKQWVNNVCLGEGRGAFLAICNITIRILGVLRNCDSFDRVLVVESALRFEKKLRSGVVSASTAFQFRRSFCRIRLDRDTLFRIFHASYETSFISTFNTIYFRPSARIISLKNPVECNLNGNGCEELCRFDERMCIILVAGTCERLESQLAIRRNEPREKLVRRN